MKSLLIVIAVILCFVGFARAQSGEDFNDTDTPTCPPEPTCPPIQECTCPPVTECPTTESTRTRTRPPGPRTRAGRTRTDRTNRTRTDTGRTRSPGPRTRGRTRTDETTNRTRTDTRSPGPRTRGRTRTDETTNRTRTDTRSPGPRTMGRTRTDETTNRTRTDTRSPGPRTRGRTRTDDTTNRTRTDTRSPGPRTRTRTPRDCTPKLPPGCEDTTTGPMVLTTARDTTEPSTSQSTPPVVPQNTASCSSAVIDATGQREIPMVALQFYISGSDPYTFAREAEDFGEVIAILAAESGRLDTVNAAVLGISARDNELAVTVAVSFNITANKDYSQSSSQIVKAVYDNLDELEEYYHVKDMKTLKMDARSINPSGSLSNSETTSGLSDSSVAAIALSVLGMIGILCVVTLLTVKLSTRFPRKPTEKQPLLEDRVNESRKALPAVMWKKQNDTIIF